VEESGLAFPKPADAWIDQQGRLRKMHYTVSVKSRDEATPGRMTIETTLELYDFGVEVNVTPPPANQVEVIRPDLPPLGCTDEEGNAKAESPGNAKPDIGQAEGRACSEGRALGNDADTIRWCFAPLGRHGRVTVMT
jgi:hypothetical protein